MHLLPSERMTGFNVLVTEIVVAKFLRIEATVSVNFRTIPTHQKRLASRA